MERRDMKHLFELLAEVVEKAPDQRPDADALALMQAARRLAPDLDWLLARRLLESGVRVVPLRPAVALPVRALSALSIAGRTD
jgi:hypothetical protein